MTTNKPGTMTTEKLLVDRRKRKMRDYKLVPIGPTPEMIEAGARQVTIIDSAAESAEKVYRAMWAAAPQPAEQQPDVAQLVEALEDIDAWVSRWCADDHPIASVARKALAAHRKRGGES